jgi:DNA-binding response OmpR family regulator
VTQRVLVVDDSAVLRAAIRRALSAGGYIVDTAATLAESLTMSPAGYDAVLVDANLGAQRGADLIETLRSQDETVVARCLVITGGAVDRLPDGVASLAKPFLMSDLLDAVRALHQPDTAAEPGGPTELSAGQGIQPAPAAPPAGRRSSAAEPQVGELLRIIRQLRAREHRELADYLHDGPIQELTAASLELQLIRRSASCSPGLESAQQQVDAASGALRGLVDRPWPSRPAQPPLTEVVREQTAWLLAAPAGVTADIRPAATAAGEARLVADLVELMLLATEAAGPATRARVNVAGDQGRFQIELILASVRDDQSVGDPAAARRALARLASALGADIHADFSGRQWRVSLALWPST